jgi:hypothetical protein
MVRKHHQHAYQPAAVLPAGGQDKASSIAHDPGNLNKINTRATKKLSSHIPCLCMQPEDMEGVLKQSAPMLDNEQLRMRSYAYTPSCSQNRVKYSNKNMDSGDADLMFRA